MTADEARKLMPQARPLGDREYLVKHIDERIRANAEAGRDKVILYFRVKPDDVIEYYRNQGYVVTVGNTVTIEW
jgi:hypothetical protein